MRPEWAVHRIPQDARLLAYSFTETLEYSLLQSSIAVAAGTLFSQSYIVAKDMLQKICANERSSERRTSTFHEVKQIEATIIHSGRQA